MLTVAEFLGDPILFCDGDWVESKDQDQNGDVRLIQLADIGDGEWLDKSNKFLTTEKSEQLRCTELKVGDVLVSRMPEPLGRACLFPGSEKKCVTVVDVCIIRVDPTKVCAKYLMYMLNSPACRREVLKFATGTTRQRISRRNLEKIKVPALPLGKQEQIVAILEKATSLKAKVELSMAELDKLQQSVFLDMFGDPVTNSKRWIDTEELCDHAMISSGITKGRRLREAKVTPVPYLAVSNVQDQRIVLEHVKTIEATSQEIARYALEKGDILLTEGGDPDKLGRGAIWEGQINPCIHQNHVFKVRLNSAVLRREFLSALLSSARGKRYFLRGAKQTTGIASINMSQLKKFPLLIPPLELQDRYVAFLDQLSAQRQIFQTQSAEMEMLFKSLQQRAFSGDL